MSTDSLIDRLLQDTAQGPSAAAIQALHALLDDSSTEPPAAPKSVTGAARALGLPTSTLRYYERQDLVHPARGVSGYREYAPADMRRLVFLTRMRLSGMSMTDLKTYIDLVEQGPSTTAQRRALMLAHREKIVRQQRELALALEATDYKIATYNGHPDG